jgi:hypothetical protein
VKKISTAEDTEDTEFFLDDGVDIDRSAKASRSTHQ